MRAPPFLLWGESWLFFLQQNSRNKKGHCRQEPLDAPELHCLPIEQCGGGKDQAGYHGCNHASTTQNECHQRGIGKSQSVAEGGKIDTGTNAGYRCIREVGAAVSPADVAKAGAYYKISAAILADLLTGLCVRRRFMPGCNRRFPEFLALIVIGCHMCHKKSLFVWLKDKGT